MTDFTTHTGATIRCAIWTASNDLHFAIGQGDLELIRRAQHAINKALDMVRDFTMELDGLEVNTKIHKSVPDNVPPKKIRPS